ncbi:MULTISPECIES: WXG100 family type VII secretion target [Paenibacillus]|uniref:WXG100 family type VII secretion target n=1 Tax=Paenibacillus TaxID=44249 RepID=UPI0009D7037E|nr:WXG100 family type VII secretion target [Paenibacillus odorifer]
MNLKDLIGLKKHFLSSFLYKNNHLKERLMMATSKVTLSYDGLAGQAKIIKNYGTEVDALIKKVMTTMKNLNSVWEDEAARDFTDKVEKLKPTFDKFAESLQDLGDHMNTVSTKYKELSNAVKNSQKF